jgi:hypothetical protein
VEAKPASDRRCEVTLDEALAAFAGVIEEKGG